MIGGCGMSFQEKSTLATTGILMLVFGWYFTLVLRELADTLAGEIAYQGLMIPVIVLLVVLAAVAHAVIAMGAPADADVRDERDRTIGLRGQEVAGYVLAVGTVAGLGLAVVDADAFWIAQVLLAGLVLAEIAEGVTRLLLYRRGA
jgi:hypothetical protein